MKNRVVFVTSIVAAMLLLGCGPETSESPSKTLTPSDTMPAPADTVVAPEQPSEAPAEACMPALDIELEGSTALLTFQDCPHPGPRTTTLAGWGYAQINVRAAEGSFDAEVVRLGGTENNVEASDRDFFSLLVYPDHPSRLETGKSGPVGVASVTEFSLEMSRDADVRISAYPSNGECILDARIVDGRAEVVESARLWRWANERHFCTKPDVAL